MKLLDGVEVIGSLVAHLEDGEPMDALAASAFVEAVRMSVRRGDSLDETLGLAAAGKRSLQRRLLTLQRDQYLCAALAAVCIDENLSGWQRCKRLAPLIMKFDALDWKRARRALHPPSDWPSWKQALFRAAQTDIPLPTTPERLYQIMKSAPQDSFSRKGAMLLTRYL